MEGADLGRVPGLPRPKSDGLSRIRAAKRRLRQEDNREPADWRKIFRAVARRYKLDAAAFGDLTLCQLSCLLESDEGEDGAVEFNGREEFELLLESLED